MLKARDFQGEWMLGREIIDRMSGKVGRMTGIAQFTPALGGLAYHETGQMRLGDGPVFNAERRYRWIFADNVEVQFDDGRAFHRFTPSGKGQGTDHPCGDDYYRVTYDFTAWPIWSATWHVTGPRKDYTSTTQYTRA